MSRVVTFIRKKKIKGYTHYYVVEGVYTRTGKLKQKVLRYLGTVENILKKFNFWNKNN